MRERIALLGEAGFPARLASMPVPPPKIHLIGAPPPDGPAIAIVGARRASEAGRRIARRLARSIAESGVAVISGGAIGIDREAHLGALEGGGKTWVVLPTPIAAPSPRSNRDLFARVLAAEGGWISERDGPVHRSAFVTRNRLIAALADAVVVVEAAAQSGTRATATFARKLGRPIGAVPWSLGDLGGEGCLRLLLEGARVVTTAGDVLKLIGRRVRREVKVEPSSLVEALALGPATAEALAERFGRPIALVLAELGTLEITGAIEPVTGGRFARTR